MLPVDLETIEAPLAERLAREGRGVQLHGPVGRAQVLGIPPSNLLRRTIGIAQQPVVVLAFGARAGIDGQRRPPQLRLESGRVNALYHGLHVRIAGRELGRVRPPVAFGDLPAVVDHRPAEAELLHHRQAVEDLLRCELAAIAPRAPDRLERVLRRRRNLQALMLHERGVGAQRGEMIAAVHAHESARGVEARTGRQRKGALRAQRQFRVAAALAAHRQRHQFRRQFNVADRQADVATPNVDDRRAAAVIGTVHAEEVAARVAGFKRQQPIRAAFVGRRLVRPERRFARAGLRSDLITLARVAQHAQRGGAVVGITDSQEQPVRPRRVACDLDALDYGARVPGENDRVPNTQLVADFGLRAALKLEVAQLTADREQRFRLAERPQGLRAVEGADHATVHLGVELEPQAVAGGGERSQHHEAQGNHGRIIACRSLLMRPATDRWANGQGIR